MKQTMTTHQIADALKSDEYAGWSWAGSMALAEYLEQYEEETEQEMEFDRVAIRCDFSEYESLEEWAQEHFGAEDLESVSDLVSDESLADSIRSYINMRASLIEFDGGIIVSSF